MTATQNLLFRLCFWIGTRAMALSVYVRHCRIYTWDNAVTYVWVLLYEGQNHFDRLQLAAAKPESEKNSKLIEVPRERLDALVACLEDGDPKAAHHIATYLRGTV